MVPRPRSTEKSCNKLLSKNTIYFIGSQHWLNDSSMMVDTCIHYMFPWTRKGLLQSYQEPWIPTWRLITQQTPIYSKDDSQRLPYDRSCRRHSNSWKGCGVWKWPRRAVQVPTGVHWSWKADICIVNLVTGATGTTGRLGCRRFCPQKLVCKETWRVQSLYGT